MSTPSPLVPKGSIQDPPKGRRNLPVLVFSVIGFHVAALGVALMIGCKPETSPKVDTGVGFVATNEPPPFVTDTSSLTGNAAPETNPYQMPAPPAAAPGTLLAGSSSNVPPIGSMPAPGFSTESETSGVPAVPIPANGGYRSPGGFADPIVPAVEPATSSMTEHKVKSGESFSTMAQHYGVSVNAIVAANPNLNPRRLQVGQIVMIPAPSRAPAASRSGTASAIGASGGTTGSYAVKPGDTLTKIAANHGTTVKALKSLNGLKTDRINVGQKLKVPVKAAPAPERTSEPVSNPAPTNSTFGTVPPAGGPAPAVPVPSPSGL